MNKDQLFSALNYVLAIGASFLVAKGVELHLVNMLVGSVAIAVSFGLAIWMNLGSIGDIIMSCVRRLLVILFAYASFRGWINGDSVDGIINTLMAFVPILLSQWHYSPAPGPNLPGTTVVDPVPVITPAATEAAQ